MLVMKRFLLLLLMLPFLLFPSCPYTLLANAEESPTYAVAASENVYLYKDKSDSSGLFILPHTYYVKVLSVEEPFCAVEYHTDEAPYKKVSGYCKKAELTFVDFVPERPFLKKEISVTYSLPESDFMPSGDGFLQSVSVDYLFYGEFPVGSARYAYVYGNGAFGYLPVTEKIAYERNTDYLKTDAEEMPPPAEDATDERAGISGTTIFFLVALGLSAVAIIILVIRGKRPPVAIREEQESEF